MTRAFVSVLQLSDMHLFSHPTGELLHVKTEDSFRAVLALLKTKHTSFDHIILSGDLAQDSQVASYQRLATLLSDFKVPIYAIPGNHDNPDVLKRAYQKGPILVLHHVILEHWQFVFLHSFKQGTPQGELSKEQLHILKRALSVSSKHAAIVLHHPPCSVESNWLDSSQLVNAEQLFEVIAPFKQVRTIICGHIHQAFQKQIGDIMIYAAPSTCIQFQPKQHQFTLDTHPPGYRWFRFFEDGAIETGIERIAHYIGVFDQNATGY